MQSSSVSIAVMWVAIFLLYTNLPVVAAQGGLIPGAAAGVVLALLLLAAVHQIVVRRRPLIVDRTFFIAMALLCVFIVSTVNALGYDSAINRITVFVTEGLLVYLVVRNAIRTRDELRAAMGAMLVAATLLAVLTTIQNVTGNYDQEFMGLAQRAYGDPNARSETVNLEDRARGPMDEPNRFAQVLLMAVPVGFVMAKNAHRMRGRVFAATCMLLVLGGVLFTYSRGAFLTLVVLMLLAVPMRLLRLRGLLITGAVAAVLMLAVVPGYLSRIVSIAGVAEVMGGSGPAPVEADGATLGRSTEMLAALAAYIDHPLLGVGPGQYVTFHSQHYQALPEISIRDLTEPRRAHNLYLEMAAETGTIGLVVFMLIPILLLRDLELLRRLASTVSPARARLAAAFSLVLLSYLGTGMFLHLAYERYYWFMIGLVAAAAGILRDELVAIRETEPLVTVAASDTPLVPTTGRGGAYAC